ncbi:hypothetical protein FB567DRAFT_535470 [Paraphoma chrysanthemicola]|uniref:Celp0028 effector like protein n=1 Tax=Paraphoma chrysanthemicola TaxID=798071 RepID=A0A8K0QZ63_9PLEO|nr:hypothetical protein FB567DRAFT_535470 [Paraphoma chrysanthemicola]
MHFTQTLALVSVAALAAAAPAPVNVGADDVILYGNGRFAMMKRSDLADLEAARNSPVAPPKPGYLDENLQTYTGNDTRAPNNQLNKRATSIIIPNPNSRFLGWDVQMSQVVKGAPTSISITSGFSITNSISVGTSASLSIVEEFLSVSMSIDYSQSWESSQSQQFTADVPIGKYGAFVSNPWTDRASGNVWTGTIGGEGSLAYYQADSFAPKSFDTMNWVDGVISLCTGDSFPLNRCLGEGTL